MAWKLPKQTIQITIDRDDLDYLEEIGRRYSRKNPSQAISMLIKHTLQMEKRIETLTAAFKTEKKHETYEEVRTDQIKRIPPEAPQEKYDPRSDPKWAFLGTPTHDTEKSRIDDPRFKQTKKED